MIAILVPVVSEVVTEKWWKMKSDMWLEVGVGGNVWDSIYDDISPNVKNRIKKRFRFAVPIPTKIS